MPDAVEWYYESNGKREGGVSRAEIVDLIDRGTLVHGSLVWCSEFDSWRRIEETEFRSNLSAPPLPAAAVSNGIIWVVAFALPIGLILEEFVADLLSMSPDNLWFITVALNVGLCYLDENRLSQAGHDTDRFGSWAWLVPVYLYQRARATGQRLGYFVVWMAWFALLLVGSVSAGMLSGDAASGPDSCVWAMDGECDEPNLCDPGTDTTDCYPFR